MRGFESQEPVPSEVSGGIFGSAGLFLLLGHVALALDAPILHGRNPSGELTLAGFGEGNDGLKGWFNGTYSGPSFKNQEH